MFVFSPTYLEIKIDLEEAIGKGGHRGWHL